LGFGVASKDEFWRFLLRRMLAMFQGRRVVSVTPYGRHRYVAILAQHLLKLRGLIDEHHFWINTDDADDLAFVKSLAAAYPDFFRLVYDSSRYSKKACVPRICWFWQKCDEDDTLYLKFDDDLVWMDDGAIERLMQFRLDNPEYLAVFPNTINNSLCSHLHQRMGLLPESPLVEYECLGEVSWQRWQTARDCHQTFLSLHEMGETARYHFATWQLGQYERFSINAMCWLGSDLAEPARRFEGDDEAWVTEIVPKETQRPCCIVGDSLVAHFAYGPQRVALEANTDLLSGYRKLAPQEHAAEIARLMPQPARGLAGRLRGLWKKPQVM
jgi:hypothetical protein